MTASSLLLLLALTACGPGPEPPTPAVPSPTVAPAATPVATPPPIASDWTLTPAGAGPVRFGMTESELHAALQEGIEPLGPPGECSYVVPGGAPEGLAFMVVGGRVVRADIRRGSSASTSIGLRSGESEARAQELLGPATEVTPHKYVEGHYLTAPTGERDTWWVAATDSGTVTDIRAGLMPQVRWVEGCS